MLWKHCLAASEPFRIEFDSGSSYPIPGGEEMPIPDDVLEQWSRQGSTAPAKESHSEVRDALSRFTFPGSHRPDAFLQGSYANDTNIHGESDVDLVVHIDSVFIADTQYLTAIGKAQFNQQFPDSEYSWADFKRDVIHVLRQVFGSAYVEVGDKAIRVTCTPLPVDVIPAIQRRIYVADDDFASDRYLTGITFYSAKLNKWIDSYPELQQGNETDKHSSSGYCYKPTVRMFKNAREAAIKRGLISDASVAPSYFVESALFNVPDADLSSNLGLGYCNSLINLSQCVESELVQSNKIYRLLGSDDHEWNAVNFQAYLSAMTSLWVDW